MRKFPALLLTSRPISWLNTAYPFAAGYLMNGGRIDTTLVIGTLYFLIPYNLLMYGVNDIFDYESDIQNPRKGGAEGAVTRRALHPVISRAITLTNLPLLAILFWFGAPLTNLLLVIVVAAAIYYSAPPLRLKEHPVLDSLTSSLHFTGPLIYALSFHGFSRTTLIMAITFFVWGIASHAFGAVQDILPDRRAGIRSIATIWGARRTTRFATLLYLTAGGILTLQGGITALAGIPILAYVANIIPYWSVSDATASDTHAAWRRFLWLNYIVGFLVTCLLIVVSLHP